MCRFYSYHSALQQNWNRRTFVTTGLSAAGVVLVGGLIGTKAKRLTRGCIRLLPVDGVVYSESFTRFMQRAKFDSVRDAIASIRDRSLPVSIAHIHANDLKRPLSRAQQSMVCESRRAGNSRTAAHFPDRAEESL